MEDNELDALRTGGGLDAYASALAELEVNDALLNREVGDYQITSLLATGGMSRVYRAVRTDGAFEREVAIKVSPGSSLSTEMRSRFLRERAILAGLNHPNVAQLYDAGITEEGWPYLVMELVEGQPIDAYCREQDYQLNDVIRLCMEITEALAFAHTRLVVHCDLKPSNILVDSGGRPMLLDFGIAKLLDTDAEQTGTRRPLSPRYASPEQLLGQEITTTSDIYQIGALLYQLCTGAPVTEGDSLVHAIERASRGDIALSRLTHLKELPRPVAQVISLCLRDEPDARYQDMNALRQDLDNFLKGYPVRAMGNNPAYRVRQFWRRNKALASVSMLAVAVLAVASTAYVVNVTEARNAAEQEKQLAEESLQFLLGFFDSVAPEQSRDHAVTAREVIDKGLAKVKDELQDKPEVQAKLMSSLASLYIDLGEPATAVELSRQARDYFSSTYGEEHGNTRQTNAELARALYTGGEYAAAAEIYQYLADLDDRLDGPAHPNSLRSKSNLAGLYFYLGRQAEALRLSKDVYELTEETLGPTHLSTLTRGFNYAMNLRGVGELEQSLPMMQEQLRTARQTLGETHPLTLRILEGVAANLAATAQNQAALEHFEEQARLAETVHGKDHPATLNARLNVADLHNTLGHAELGFSMQSDLVPRLEAALGSDHPRVVEFKSQMAVGLVLVGRVDEGRGLSRNIIEQQTHQLGSDHPSTLVSQIYYGRILALSADPGAEFYFTELLAKVERALGEAHFAAQRIRDELMQLQGKTSIPR